jgi:uncharacterized protein YggU (UPF0235/DUF167 family)
MAVAGPDRDEGLRVAVRVKPAASRTAVGGRHGDVLIVAVTAKPAGGRATEAVLRAVAEAFGVPRSGATLVFGAASSDKVISIAGPAEGLVKRLDALLDQ